MEGLLPHGIQVLIHFDLHEPWYSFVLNLMDDDDLLLNYFWIGDTSLIVEVQFIVKLNIALENIDDCQSNYWIGC